MGRFLTHWLIVTLALAVAARVLAGVHVDSLSTLLVASLVVGFSNAIIRPILTFLTLPITCLTLGLFYLVVNGIGFALAAWLVDGFHVASFGSAVLGALIVSIISWFITLFTGDPRRSRRRSREL
jgi:putative membrane protein